ncbi:MAG: hypothetical protein ACFFKA_21370 [Candidatus Thorarchaeota archaeon]
MIMEDPILKEYIVKDIIRGIKKEGYNIEKSNVDDFLENFIAEYERLPKKKEIGPIVTSYIKMMIIERRRSSTNQDNENQGSKNKVINSFLQNMLDKKNLIDINYNKSIYNSGKVLIIPKPNGRRLCPICENENWFKIHETIDKSEIISHYPRIYGKTYTCSGCGCAWKEK